MFKSKEEAAAYLSGLIDGEGHIRAAGYSLGCVINIYNTDKGIIEGAQAALHELNVSYSVYTRNPRGISKLLGYILRIGTQKEIEKLAPHLKLQSKAKKANLEAILKHYKTSNQKRLPQYKWPLEELGILLDSGMTQRQAATKLNVAQSTIERWNRARLNKDPRPSRPRRTANNQ